MSDATDKSPPQAETAGMQNISELLSYAFALETEAYERYSELADMMDTHHNKQVAELFRKMAHHEKQHGEQIRQWAEEQNLSILTKVKYKWTSPEGPETADPGDMHYLMTPHQALTLALHNEQRAHRFFADIVEQTTDEEAGKLASHLAEEETRHVSWMQEWLDKFPATEDGWDEDDDPPVLQD